MNIRELIMFMIETSWALPKISTRFRRRGSVFAIFACHSEARTTPEFFIRIAENKISQVSQCPELIVRYSPTRYWEVKIQTLLIRAEIGSIQSMRQNGCRKYRDCEIPLKYSRNVGVPT